MRPRQCRARTGDHGIRSRVGVDCVERFGPGDAEPAPLTGCEGPVAAVRPDHRSSLVGDRSRPRLEAVPLEERPVVAAREEARLLRLRPAGGRQSRARRLGARLVLSLVAERKPDTREQARLESREHVALVLLLVDGTCEVRAFRPARRSARSGPWRDVPPRRAVRTRAAPQSGNRRCSERTGSASPHAHSRGRTASPPRA